MLACGYRTALLGRIFCDLVEGSLYKAPEGRGVAICDTISDKDWACYELCVILRDDNKPVAKTLHDIRREITLCAQRQDVSAGQKKICSFMLANLPKLLELATKRQFIYEITDNNCCDGKENVN